MMKEYKNISIPWFGVIGSIFVCALLLAPLVWRNIRVSDSLHNNNETVAVAENTNIQKTKRAPSEVIFEAPKLKAVAAVVYDTTTNTELYSLNGETQLPLASLTKIMTAITAREVLGTDQTIVIGEKTLKADGDGLLKTGKPWKLSNLLDWTLVRSSNDGAVAIASAWEAVEKAKIGNTSTSTNFVSAMNARAKELGLTQTYFLNETGLDLNEKLSGAYGSAKDIAKLFTVAVCEFPETFEATRYHDLTINAPEGTYKTKNTNEEVESLPSVIASKTGFTDLAGGNLVIMFDAGPNHPIVVSVLGSTQEDRLEDVSALVKASLSYIQQKEQNKPQ